MPPVVVVERIRNALAEFWRWLREVSEDDAYERYCASFPPDRTPSQMTAASFYRERMERKYSRPSRCC